MRRPGFQAGFTFMVQLLADLRVLSGNAGAIASPRRLQRPHVRL
jgi:hypothetical protein